jgi:hypothetical protein
MLFDWDERDDASRRAILAYIRGEQREECHSNSFGVLVLLLLIVAVAVIRHGN